MRGNGRKKGGIKVKQGSRVLLARFNPDRCRLLACFVHESLPPPGPKSASLHDDGGDVHVGLDGLVRQDAAAVDVDLVTDCDIVAEDGHVLEARPFADDAVPAHNGLLNPSMVLDLGPLQEDALLQADTVPNDHVRPDSDMRPYLAVVADLGRGVDHYVAVNVRLGVRGEELGLPLLQRPQVELCAGDEVLGLADIHPEALKVERVQLAVPDHGREGFLLDGGGAQVDAIENRGVEDVDAGVDAVADELDGLLNETLDAGRVARLVHNDTVLGGLLDLCDTDGALVSMFLVECDEVLERVLASDVRVEDEEGSLVLEKGFGSQLQRASSAQGFCLDRKGDVDSEALGVLGWGQLEQL